MAAHLEGSMSGPWIERIGPDEADGTLAEAYERISRGRALDHILEIHTLHPQSLIDHYALYRLCIQRLLLLSATSRGGAP
jgi:hypothetical protein